MINSNEKEVLSLLDNHFPQFSDELKNVIASFATVRTIMKGEILIHEGQYLKHTVLIAEGRAKLYREFDDGGEVFMYYLEAGNACALSMLCASRQLTSEVTAKAIENSTLIMIPIQHTDELMKYHKDWYNFVIETYRYRFEELLEAFDNVVFKSMDDRLETYLKNQFNHLHTKKLELTHQEIANDLNTSREVVSRLLKKMEQQGKIVLSRKDIESLSLN